MLSQRTVEIGTAVLTGAFGVAIVVGSLAIGVGWTPRGLGPGSFPALAGALIVAGSVYNVARGAVKAGPMALDGPRLKQLAATFVPAVLFVAAIPLLGLHVAAGLYVLGVVAAHRKTPWPRIVALAIATPLALYATFDWAFQVTLPRGLLGAALGF